MASTSDIPTVKPSNSNKCQNKMEYLYTTETMTMILNDYRKKGEFCDVKLKVEDKEFPANKNILAALSPFFKAMFSGNFAEAHQDCISLTSIDADVMETILEYAYTTKIEIDENNVRPVLQAAHFYQMESIVELCRRFLENNINAATSLGIWAVAELYSWSDLVKEAKEYSLKEFTKVCGGLEFLQLEADKLAAILKYDSLNVLNEKQVLDAVIWWFYFKEKERQVNLEKVLQNVRLAHIDPAYLLDRIQENKTFWQSESVRKLVEDAKNYFYLPHRRQEMQSSITIRRHNAPQVETLQLDSMTADKQRIIVYISEDGRLFNDIPHPCPGLAYYLVPCNYKLMAFSVNCHALWYYNDENDTWRKIAGLLNPRESVGIGEADGYWYAIGGVNPDGSFSSHAERYEVSTNEWTPIAPLLNAVANPLVLSVSGKIYVVGGNKNEMCVRVQRYSPNTNEWKRSMPWPGIVSFVHTRPCALQRHIYMFCVPPFSREKVLYAYNIDTEIWKDCAKTTHTFLHGPVVLNGKIIALSKNSDGDRVLECYNPSLNSWTDQKKFKGVKPQWIKGPFLMSRNRENFKLDRTLAGVCA